MSRDEEIRKIVNELLKDRRDLDSHKLPSEFQNKRSIQNNFTLNNGELKKAKRKLIGIIPSFLLNKSYFPRNNLILEFAKKSLKIKIPHGGKKSREEIMGIIVAELDKEDPIKIVRLMKVMDKMVGKEEKGDIKNFFFEWDKAINEL